MEGSLGITSDYHGLFGVPGPSPIFDHNLGGINPTPVKIPIIMDGIC